jgi:hypothetical protein
LADQTEPYVVERLMDMNLRVLARLAEESDNNRLPITLNIPGTVLYGYLVSPSAWRTRWVERIGAMQAEGNGIGDLTFLPDSVRSVVGQVLKEEGIEVPEPGLPRWLHMVDVRMVTGAMNTLVDVPLWRGRVEDVAGWSFGLPD